MLKKSFKHTRLGPSLSSCKERGTNYLPPKRGFGVPYVHRAAFTSVLSTYFSCSFSFFPTNSSPLVMSYVRLCVYCILFFYFSTDNYVDLKKFLLYHANWFELMCSSKLIGIFTKDWFQASFHCLFLYKIIIYNNIIIIYKIVYICNSYIYIYISFQYTSYNILWILYNIKFNLKES